MTNCVMRKVTLLVVAKCAIYASTGMVAAIARTVRPSSSAEHSLRQFTVADSIRMTHFVVPNEGASEAVPFSPSKKSFFVITERGLLDKNLREFSLLVYKSDRLAAPPAVAATFKTSSNRDGIAQAEWLDDRHIAFIGELPGKTPQVYIVDCSTWYLKKATVEDEVVVSYAFSKDQHKLLYYTEWTAQSPADKYRKDHGFAVADERLMDLVNGNWRRPHCMFRLHTKNLLNGSVKSVGPHLFCRGKPSIWLSPDGRYAITIQSAVLTPRIWESYDDPFVKRYVRERLTNHSRIASLSETVLVDTKTMQTHPLVGAPCSVGRSLTTVVWAANSRSAVVGATLLPLNTGDPEEFEKRRAHPVVAAVDIASGISSRLLEIPNDVSWVVLAGSSPDTFQITGWKVGPGGDLATTIQTRRFRRQGTEWVEDRNSVREGDGENVTLRQSLNRWPVLVRVQQQTPTERVILDPNPQFRNCRFGRRVVVNWTGKRGEPLTGGLVYPADFVAGRRYPLVIQTHGFSPELYLLDGPFTTAFAAEALANKGIMVLQLPESPLEHVNNGLQRGPAMQSQLESGVDYLDTLGLIDRNRVGLVGFSITGFAVMYTLMKSSYHFAVATSAEGNDFGYWSYVADAAVGDWASQSEAPYGGNPWNNNWESWMRESISFNYDKIHTPLRLESDNNDRAAIIYEWEKFIALRRLHKPVELIFVSHGEHPVVKPWDRLTSQQGNVDWLLFWLQGEEDPDPSKAEQYTRWHELQKLHNAHDEH
jgi:dipeptidyl aminopeptidase/acylaminoacyl peptidase